MKAKDIMLINSAIEDEGFWYCFTGYSAWRDIEDEKFHELREKMLKAADELKEYIGCED